MTDDRFQVLQRRMVRQYQTVFQDSAHERTVLVLPSLTMDQATLSSVGGVHHYEERMLCLLMLLRYPRAKVVFLSSTPIDPRIVDYYLHLLPGVPSIHARDRLTMVHCHDASPRSLAEKILERPRVLHRIKREILNVETAHLACFTVTELERELALALDVPIFGCDPALEHLGSKSGSREIFREANVPMPYGSENLRDDTDVCSALVDLRRVRPSVKKAAIKLNYGFSGAGNATFSFEGAPDGQALEEWVRSELAQRLDFEDESLDYDEYFRRFEDMEGIVEEFVLGDEISSPSVQLRVEPDGTVHEVSTHDQVLGGHSGQAFMGCTFPAHENYRQEIATLGRRAGGVLRDRGVLGRFAIDFVSVRCGSAWEHYAIEVNLRKGGTTHPFLMLQFLTDGTYSEEDGIFRTLGGEPRYYFASDNLHHDCFRGLTPRDVIDITVQRHLHFHGASQQGVVFHLIGAVSEWGKLGVVAVGDSPEKARQLYLETESALREECAAS